MRMRRHAAEALLLFLAGEAGCGEDIANDVAAPDAAIVTDATSDADAAVDAPVGDGDAADAPPTFCDTTDAWTACEDFELGLPPTRGFIVPTNGGLVLTDDAGGADGGRAGRVVVDMVDAAADNKYARLATGIKPGDTSYHLELTAKIERDGPGDVTVAELLVAGASQSNSISVLVQESTTIIYFCVSGACVQSNVAETFASFTHVALDVASTGAMNVAVGGHMATNAGTDVGPVTRGDAWVGMVFTGTGARRVVVFDDALISSQ